MAVLVFLVLRGTQGCPWESGPFTLSAEHRAFIRAESLTPIEHVADLPSTVRRVLILHEGIEQQQTGETPSTGTGIRVVEPSARFVLAGCGPDHCIVEFVQDRYVPTIHVILFGLYEGLADVEWHGFAPQGIGGVEELESIVLRDIARRRFVGR
jgi:hypothetical protein